jgi:hypothetical protein
MTPNADLQDLEPVAPAVKPDRSWWSEGLFIASIFPPLVPLFLQLDHILVSLISFGFIALLLSLCFALVIAKPSQKKSHLKAIALGTALGTLILISCCIYY